MTPRMIGWARDGTCHCSCAKLWPAVGQEQLPDLERSNANYPACVPLGERQPIISPCSGFRLLLTRYSVVQVFPARLRFREVAKW